MTDQQIIDKAQQYTELAALAFHICQVLSETGHPVPGVVQKDLDKFAEGVEASGFQSTRQAA